MEFIRRHTRLAPASERAGVWADINREHFGHLVVDAMDEGLDEAELTLFEVDDLRVFRIDVPAHKVSRARRHADDGLDGSFKLLLQREGRGRIRQGGREFALRAGDWSLYDPRTPYSIENFQRTSLLALQIPRERLRGLSVLELHTCESPTHAAGLSAVLGSFLQSLLEQLPSLPEDAAPAVAETVLGLLSATLAQRQVEAHEYATLPAVLKARVRQYVQTHWADPSLGVGQIADAMRCSKRHLHRAFEDESQTLERYIWRTRLTHARRMLLSATARPSSIGLVASACGFRSGAHFCRAFRAEYGVAPSEVRPQSQFR